MTDPAWRVVNSEEIHRIEADGTEEATFSFSNKVLKEAAIEQSKHGALRYSKSAQEGEITEAYTLKKDGRRIEVPKSNYQYHTDTGKGDAGPAFSDLVEIGVVYPDVEVGDTVVMSYKLKTLQPLFPGKLSLLATYPRQVAYDKVHVVLDVPDSMHPKYRARGMLESVTHQGGRTHIDWTYENRNPEEADRTNFSVYDLDSEPGFLFSTFGSYEEIAESYVKRAQPKAAVTDRIRELAQQITAGKANAREQARSLYEWVSENITYGGNCIGIGAVVPRDLDVVLDNKMGDCKDHATLLEALLAAKGIESQQALVNAINVYRLPEIPVASLVNHVITYIPALDLFADSTAQGTPFGYLPLQDQDKPVLMAGTHGTLRHTPVDAPDSNRQEVKSRAEIHDDGSVDATVEVKLHGQYAFGMRRDFKRMSKDDERLLVRRVLEGSHLKGDGTVTHDDPTPLSDSFSYTVTLHADNVVALPGSSAFQLQPMFLTPAPVGHFAAEANRRIDEYDQACSTGISDEDLEVTLPPSMKVLSIPDGTAFNSKILSYESQYELQGRKLHSRRHLEDRSPAAICSPAVQRAYSEALQPVWKDVRQQVLYK